MGEGLHRRSRIGTFSLVIVSVIAVVPSPLAADPQQAAWVSARGGTAFPAERIDVRRDLRERTFFGFISSWSNPYSIDNLITSSTRIGLHSRRCAMWVGWTHLHHTLYREDLISLDLGSRVMGKRLLLAVRPALRRQRVRGFPASSSHDLTIGAACHCTPAVDIGFGTTFSDRESRPVQQFVMMLSVRLGGFALVLNHISAAPFGREIRVGVEIELDRRLTIVSGYRTGIDEISAGVLIRAGGYLVGMSVNHHVVLRQTVSFSIGRLWVR
jgi:hypothetical protein